jgi:hypothetical protein
VNQDRAATIALQGIAHIVNDEHLLDAFTSYTGVDPQAFKAALADEGFLAAVLGFLLDEESRVLAFAAAADLNPEEVQRAWQILSGEDRVWYSV